MDGPAAAEARTVERRREVIQTVWRLKWRLVVSGNPLFRTSDGTHKRPRWGGEDGSAFTPETPVARAAAHLSAPD